MKSVNYTYTTPSIEIMEVDLESVVLTESKTETDADNEELVLDYPFNLFGT